MNLPNFVVPIYKPSISHREKQLVLDCLDSSWISSRGEYIKKFEKLFSSRVGVSYALAVNNGTAALHVALLAAGVGVGDEVIVPSLTYIASVNAITYTGATPIFAEVDSETWCLDVNCLDAIVTEKTKAILLVHLYGNSCDMEPLIRFSQSRGIMVIEDCAEAFGTLHNKKHVGTSGLVSTFSFFGNKTITTGEGGMLVTESEKVMAIASRIRGQGLSIDQEYWHDIVGYNYRMTNICAAIGVAQLEKSESLIREKVVLAEYYKENFKALPLTPQKVTRKTQSSFWLNAFLAESRVVRDKLREYLLGFGIETRPVFPPVHTMPMYAKGVKLPVTEDLASRGVLLPSWPELDVEHRRLITSMVKSFYC